MKEGGDLSIEPVNLAVVAGRIYLAAKPNSIAKLRSWVQGRSKVVILGSSGVGKTQLIDSLTELLPDAISYLDRTSFSTDTSLQIGSKFFKVWDTPGQEKSSTDRSAAIRAVSNKPFGVVNVVCYGYHEYRTGLLCSPRPERSRIATLGCIERSK